MLRFFLNCVCVCVYHYAYIFILCLLFCPIAFLGGGEEGCAKEFEVKTFRNLKKSQGKAYSPTWAVPARLSVTAPVPAGEAYPEHGVIQNGRLQSPESI